MKRFSLFRSSELRYPNSGPLFRPGIAYPEYPFPAGTCGMEQNNVYDGVRQVFRLAGLDSSNFGGREWNPLGQFIRPGMNVLVKPNLVMDVNPAGHGTDCLYSHPSVIAAVIDYVAVALGGKGSIVLADAPMQSCDFEALVSQSGLRDLVEWYREQGVSIELMDLRGLKSAEDGPSLNQTIVKDAMGKVIDLGPESAFSELPSSRIDSLRITNYDPAELKKHHTSDKHEYFISDALLNADIVVNIPKVKTHRKAGITGALKNMVGVNVRKEYLPHHANGSKAEGFDEYETPSAFKRASDRILDMKNGKLGTSHILMHGAFNFFIAGFGHIGKKLSGDPFSEGSWFGNDTIWRTVLDLNKIVFHADKEGVMRDERQRRMVVIGDMVTIGQGEGPLVPEPGSWKMLTFSDDPVVHDVAMARLMGTDEALIPTVHEALLYDGSYAIRDAKEALPSCSSNEAEFDGVSVDCLNSDMRYRAKPTSGWATRFDRKE